MKTETDNAACYRFRAAVGKPWQVVPHDFRQWSELYDRCTWCGVNRRRAPSIADTEPPPPVPALAPDEPPDANTVAVREIQARFSAMARAHAATSDNLQQWKEQGNRMPRCYV